MKTVPLWSIVIAVSCCGCLDPRAFQIESGESATDGASEEASAVPSDPSAPDAPEAIRMEADSPEFTSRTGSEEPSGSRSGPPPTVAPVNPAQSTRPDSSTPPPTPTAPAGEGDRPTDRSSRGF